MHGITTYLSLLLGIKIGGFRYGKQVRKCVKMLQNARFGCAEKPENTENQGGGRGFESLSLRLRSP